MNISLFLLINDLRSPLIDLFALLGSALGNFLNFFAIVAAFLALRLAQMLAGRDFLISRKDMERMLIALTLGYLLAAASVALLKIGLHFPRPSTAMPGAVFVIGGYTESPYSFPSGHSAFAALLAFSFWPWCRLLGRAGLVLFVAWVGFARINLGAHFPIDVAAGYTCGVISGWLAAILTQRFFAFRASQHRNYSS